MDDSQDQHGRDYGTRNAWRSRCVLASLTYLVLFSSSVRAQSESTDTPEQSRLSTAIFRKALQQRGLTELLEQHLKLYPSRDPIEKLLQARELKLAEAADHYLSQDRRQQAVVQANTLLSQLLTLSTNDPRRFEWRFTLVHSLIYDEAEPFFTRLLYEQARPSDPEKLQVITSRAVNELALLQSQLKIEYAQLDHLSINEFERLERIGYIDSIDMLEPKVEYLLLWTWFYDALPRPKNDETKRQRLRGLIDIVSKNRRLLDTPHRASRIQVQMLLLVGMTHRLLHRHVIARDLLSRAIQIADRLSDPVMRQSVSWAQTLARVEQIRNERDAGRFKEAIKLANTLDNLGAKQKPEDFGVRIVAGLLQQSIYQAWADKIDPSGQSSQAQSYRRNSWEALVKLIRQRPQRRDEVYAILYSRLEPDVDPQQLNPLEQAAVIAGSISKTSLQENDPRLVRAIHLGDYFLLHAKQASSLLPEVLYNMGVAHYRLHHAADAATFFMRVAKQYTTFERSQQAAIYAVQLSAGLYEDPKWRDEPAVQTLYMNSLRLLVTAFEDTKEARYWQFQYAQLLESMGHQQHAANEYAKVHVDHVNYAEARFFRLRCLVKEIENLSTTSVNADARERVDVFFDLHRNFISWIVSDIAHVADSTQKPRLRRYLIESKLLAAEVQMFDAINRPALAIQTLDSMEHGFDEFPDLHSRLWRLKLTAYEKLGRLDEAADLIPHFIHADPQGAGPVLQSLYLALRTQVENLRAAGEYPTAQTKAETALMIAQQISQWAKRYQTHGSTDQQLAWQLQLGEANLLAMKFEQALLLFQPHTPPLTTISTAASIMARAVMGMGQALYGLEKYDNALLYFNRLATALPDDHPLKWPALLRDLECRTVLAEPAVDIIQVIHQHKFLHPRTHDDTLNEKFNKLLRENQRRLDHP